MKEYYVFWKMKNQTRRYYLGQLFTNYLDAVLFQEELLEKGFEGEGISEVDLVIGEK